jgi:EpsI family protein
LFHRWQEPVSYFDHALFVPFVCAWMAYRESKNGVTPASSSSTSSASAFALLLVALLLEFVGVAQQITFLQGLAFVLGVWSTALLFLGKSVFVRYRWPLFYLLLLIPIPTFFMAQMTLGMREMSTTLAAAILQGTMALFGRPFLRLGNELSFAGHHVTIVDACSGMNTLLTVIAVGLVLVYLEKSRLIAWITAALLVPVAILTNLIRILTICTFVAMNMESFAFGEGHVPIGLLTVGAAFSILAFGIRAPRRWKEKWDKPSQKSPNLDNSRVQVSEGQLLIPAFSLLLLAAASVFVGTGLETGATNNNTQSNIRNELMPKAVVADWQAAELPMDETTYDVVGTRDAHMFRYDPAKKSDFKKPVYVYWLRSESSRKIGHPPELCYRGENYEIVERTQTSVTSNGRTIPVIRLLVQRGDYKLLVYYWYRIGGVETASYLTHQFEWAWSRIRHFNFSAENNEASMTRLSTEVDGDSEKRLQTWIDEQGI